MSKAQPATKKQVKQVPAKRAKYGKKITDPAYNKPKQHVKNAVSLFSSHVNVDPITKSYLKNSMLPAGSMQGPAFAATNTACSHASMQRNIDCCSTGYGGVLFTNNPYYPLHELTYSVVPTAYTSNGKPIYPSYGGGAMTEKDFSLCGQVSNSDGGIINPAIVPSENGLTLQSSTRNVPYEGEYDGVISSCSVIMTQNSGSAKAVTPGYYFRTAGSTIWDKYELASVALNNGVPTTVNIPTGSFDGTYAFYVRSDYGGTSMTLTDLTITWTTGYAWRPVGFIGSSFNTQVLASWFRGATKWRVNAASLLLTNVNANLFKNGTISGMELNAGLLGSVSTDPATIMSWIATAPTPQHAVNMPLETGAFVTWMPNSTSQLELQDHISTTAIDSLSADYLSGWVVIWKSNDDPDYLQPLLANLNMSFEVQTGQQIIPMEPCPHILELWSAWLAFQAGYLRICENPKHLARIGRSVQKFVTSEEGKQTLARVGKTALRGMEVLLPLLLTL